MGREETGPEEAQCHLILQYPAPIPLSVSLGSGVTSPAFHYDVTLFVVTQLSRAGLPLWFCQGAAGTNAPLCSSCALCLRYLEQHE